MHHPDALTARLDTRSICWAKITNSLQIRINWLAIYLRKKALANRDHDADQTPY